jgi:hypothetical protein
MFFRKPYRHDGKIVNYLNSGKYSQEGNMGTLK